MIHDRKNNASSISKVSKKSYLSRLKKKKWMLAWMVIAVIILAVPISQASALMGGQGLMWTVWSSAPVELVVCWENPQDAAPLPGEADLTPGAQRLEIVRLALKHTWEREGRVVFTGWQLCQNESNPTDPPLTLGPRRPGTQDENVKVHITNYEGGMNPGHGSWGDYMQSGVLLNLHYANAAWYEFLAIHEFGHVLGYYHDEERSDWPNDIPGCPPQSWPPSPPWWPVPTELRWGAPDPDSVMAYCSGGPNEIRPKDIAGVQRSYGRHIPGTLLSLPGSLCLSDHASAPDGSGAFGWACDEANDDQEWQYDVATKALYITSPSDPSHTRRCLDVNTVDNTDVQIWSCNQGTNQQWSFQNTQLRGYGGLCMTRPASNVGPLSMKLCTGAANQMWRVEPGIVAGFVRIKSPNGAFCLEKSGASGSDAISVPCQFQYFYLPSISKNVTSRMVPPTRATSTRAPAIAPQGAMRDFILAPGGSVVAFSLSSDNLCLDVQDVWDSDYTAGLGGPADGQRVQFFTCTDSQLNQKWSFSGTVKSGVQGNKCLALEGDATSNGEGAYVSTCDGSQRQLWDYDW